eukprot:COSAG01_NODE_1401_length_10450_cov_100.148198_1_plen_39_part_10
MTADTAGRCTDQLAGGGGCGRRRGRSRPRELVNVPHSVI